MVFNPFRRAGQQRQAVSEIKNQMLAQRMAEQQMLTNNERNLIRIREERRQELIRQQLLSAQGSDQRQIFGRETILSGKNIFRNQGSILHGNNILQDRRSLLRDDSVFFRRR